MKLPLLDHDQTTATILAKEDEILMDKEPKGAVSLRSFCSSWFKRNKNVSNKSFGKPIKLKRKENKQWPVLLTRKLHY